MKCRNGPSFGCRKESVNAFLYLVHDEYATTDKRDAENCEFIPDEGCNSFQVSCSAHRSDFCTHAIKGGLLNRVSCARFRLLKFHITTKSQVDNRFESTKHFYFIVVIRFQRPAKQKSFGECKEVTVLIMLHVLLRHPES